MTCTVAAIGPSWGSWRMAPAVVRMNVTLYASRRSLLMKPNCTMLPILESGSVDAVLHGNDELHQYEAGAGTRSCATQHRRWRRPGLQVACGRSSADASPSACLAGSSEVARDAYRRGWRLYGGGIDRRHGHDGSHAQKTSFPARVKHAHTPLFADSARLTSAMLPDYAPFRMVS